MNEVLKMILIACPLCFVAGFIDSIAGGGGVISLPAYLAAGLPAYAAAGTNKFSACCGTVFAVRKYMRSGKISYRTASVSAAASLCGSAIGTSLALRIPEHILKYILLGALPLVALFLLLNRDFGKEDKACRRELSLRTSMLLSAVIGLVIGCYDGLIGPGTGTFLIICFTGLLGYDLLTSSGCAKISNLASNLAAAVIYVIRGHVVYAVGIPAALFSMAGNALGARFAIRGGVAKVRVMMFVVLALIFIKLGLESLGLIDF